MTRNILILSLLLALPFSAQAAVMRDMSLGVDDTMRQPDISNSKASPFGSSPPPMAPQHSFGGGSYGLPNSGVPNSSGLYDEDPEGALPAQSVYQFMASFCNSAQPDMGRTTAGNCMQTTKQQSCDLFQHLPKDAQAVLDRSIGCTYTISEEGNSDEDAETHVSASACNKYDSRRLRLMKKYWQEQDTVYALAFLPDMALNPMSFCTPQYRGNN